MPSTRALRSPRCRTADNEPDLIVPFPQIEAFMGALTEASTRLTEATADDRDGDAARDDAEYL
jgi:hypothetical protein